jgi:GR25 family glycosyltransferase involved in LPS biosynthesis
MNTINHIYYINLDYRKDRQLKMEDWIEESGFPSEKVTRISAVHTPQNGYFGCALSHIKALEEFLQSTHTNCIIFEDDYVPLNIKTYWDNYSNVQKLTNGYDIIMCSYNMLESEPTEFPWLHKVHKSFTTSGYLITREFAPKLIQNLKEGVTHLIEEANKTNTIDHTYVLDVYWQKLMPVSKWYCFYPRIGKQGDGYSDIQNKCVDYVG